MQFIQLAKERWNAATMKAKLENVETKIEESVHCIAEILRVVSCTLFD